MEPLLGRPVRASRKGRARFPRALPWAVLAAPFRGNSPSAFQFAPFVALRCIKLDAPGLRLDKTGAFSYFSVFGSLLKGFRCESHLRDRTLGKERFALRFCCLSVVLLCAAAAWAAPGAPGPGPSRIALGRASVDIAPRHQSPSPAEIRLIEPVREEVFRVYESAKTASAALRRIRECEKYAEETMGGEQRQWEERLAEALASQDPAYLAYLDAEKALTEALGRRLSQMSRRERLLDPLMTSYVRVVPYICARENTVPAYSDLLEKYRGYYEANRSTTAKGDEAYEKWKAGVDPTFEELNALFAEVEKQEGFLPGLLHAVAWRESEGNPQQGAENADERGLFQIQATDCQPKWGIALNQPAAGHWDQFERLCKWIPFNLALAAHCLNRFVMQAEELGFRGDDRFQLAYRFYNESSGYVLFSQRRLRIYRQLFGLSPAELSDTDIATLDRFIYFREEEILQQYDWPVEGGLTAGQRLWEAWKDDCFEVKSDLLWLILEHRLTEMEQQFILLSDALGNRWCRVDLTRQSAKRRGTPGISGLMLTAISICSARGVVPTAELLHQYFTVSAEAHSQTAADGAARPSPPDREP